MKFKIDLLTLSAYIALTWAYFNYLPEPNGWVFAFIALCAIAIDVRSYGQGLHDGGDIMQKVMKQTLDDGSWEIVRRKK
ncbi:MAG: hypothetical protein ACKO0Z_01845 [Betaproteobacteria bacterium]